MRSPRARRPFFPAFHPGFSSAERRVQRQRLQPLAFTQGPRAHCCILVGNLICRIPRAPLTTFQVWFFWAICIVLSLLVTVSSWDAVRWLFPQRSLGLPQKSYVNLNAVSSVWAAAQFMGWCYVPWLPVRRFHGRPKRCSLANSACCCAIILTLFAGFIRDWTVLSSWPVPHPPLRAVFFCNLLSGASLRSRFARLVSACCCE